MSRNDHRFELTELLAVSGNEKNHEVTVSIGARRRNGVRDNALPSIDHVQIGLWHDSGSSAPLAYANGDEHNVRIDYRPSEMELIESFFVKHSLHNDVNAVFGWEHSSLDYFCRFIIVGWGLRRATPEESEVRLYVSWKESIQGRFVRLLDVNNLQFQLIYAKDGTITGPNLFHDTVVEASAYHCYSQETNAIVTYLFEHGLQSKDLIDALWLSKHTTTQN